MIEPKREFMEAAINEAKKARRMGDYAVGAVVVRDGKVIARAGNRSKLDNDPIQHAEVIVISNRGRFARKQKIFNVSNFIEIVWNRDIIGL